MLNQYVNMTPQQKMAQMLQQQGQSTPLQGLDVNQAQMPQMQNPLAGAQNAMSMYGKMSQQNQMQDMQDYLARLKLGQSQTGGMFDSANAQAPSYTGDMGT
jgi:FMN-dependent NADH-azoreductase